MKYIIDVPEEIAEISEEFLSKAGLLCKPYVELDRKTIEDEVWEFINDAFWSMTQEDIDECYDGWFPKSYQEAKDKYNEWLKRRNEIKVGDEVIDKDGYKGIATFVYTECGLFDVLWDDGSVTEDVDKKDFFKTGRHFPEVVELLKKMKENYEEISTRKTEDNDK